LQQLDQTFGIDDGQGGNVCAGFPKLAQKVLTLMLTYDHYYDPYWGSEFGRVVSAQTLQEAERRAREYYAIAISDVTRLLRSQEDYTTPIDERIYTLELAGLTADSSTGKLDVSFKVTAISGHATVMQMPIPIVP